MGPDLMGLLTAPPPAPPGNGVPFLLRVLDAAEAARYLRVPESLLIAEAERGTIPGQLIGNEWRFSVLAFTDWLRAGRGVPKAATLGERTLQAPPPDETPEEQEAFLASIRAYRDEIDRATGHGRYAAE